MADLHWFPLYARDWLSGEGTSMMLPEQEGAFIRLLCVAWGDGSVEPSLPDDDKALARISRLGSRWRKLGALVRDQFVARDGRLFNGKLSVVWMEQQGKSHRAAENGRRGGKAKAEGKQKASKARISLEQNASDDVATGYQKPTISESELETERETTKAKRVPSRAAPPSKHAEWADRIAGFWAANVGKVTPGRVGTDCKASIVAHGELAVMAGARRYVETRKSQGKPLAWKWFADEQIAWIEKAAKPLYSSPPVDEFGVMSDEFERATRP